MRIFAHDFMSETHVFMIFTHKILSKIHVNMSRNPILAHMSQNSDALERIFWCMNIQQGKFDCNRIFSSRENIAAL